MPAWLLPLIFNRWTLALVGIGAAWLWHAGQVREHEKAIDARWEAKLAAAQAKQREAVSEWVLEASRRRLARHEVATVATQKRQESVRTIIKEVPVYVTALADSRCVVPRGFVQHHDAAAAGDAAALPGAAGGLVDADSGLALSSVERTVSENYGACHELRAEVAGWRSWYREERAIYELHRVELEAMNRGGP